MKYFVIGFNKTATCTLHELFQKNNLKSQHCGIGWDTDLYDCFSDNGDLRNFQLLDEKYPNSIFILNTRSLDKWLISRFKHGLNSEGKVNWAYPYTKDKCIEWIKNRKDYYIKLLEYFKETPNRLIIVCIDRNNWINYTCHHLGFDNNNIESKNIRRTNSSKDHVNIVDLVNNTLKGLNYDDYSKGNFLFKDKQLEKKYLNIFKNNINLTKHMVNGYLYSIYSNDGKPNEYFTNEFFLSYGSLKRAVPNCNVTLYTNIKFDNVYSINHVIYDENMEKKHIAKAIGLLKSPYDKTIFLDTDTVIHRAIINDIFDVLDEFSFTCCYGNNWSNGTIYPDFNTGLIGVKKNDFTNREIDNWVKLFDKTNEISDQKYFREIFMKNKREFHILPTYFMYRWYHYHTYPEQAVLSHDHSMSKNEITKKIISSWMKTVT